MIYNRKKSIDLKEFQSTNPPSSPKYGLPKEIQFCKRCVISNQRPNSAVEFKHTKKSTKNTIAFDEDSICDACRFAEEKKKTDWEEREKWLNDLCSRFRKSDGSYDCVVPGSGGKDSFYAAHVLKYKYNMNPLTCTWAPGMYTDVGWKNYKSWINSGFDNYLFTPNKKIHGLLTKLAFKNLLHPFQPFVLGQNSFAAKLAIEKKIKLA